MSNRGDILVVGGYGVVGRRIAAQLSLRFPDHVVIAGRDERRAEALCRELGHGTRARRIDVEDLALATSKTATRRGPPMMRHCPPDVT